jgi:hypothetical protein
MYSVSIDNLTVVGEPMEKVKDRDIKIKDKEIANYVYSIHKELEGNPIVQFQWATPTDTYHYNYKLIKGAFVQVTHESSPTPQIRLEFNPNHFKTRVSGRYMMQLLKHIKEPRPTRIDPAIDLFTEDISTYKIYDEKTRKKRLHTTPHDRLETLYLGAKSSDETIRIYDKKVESGETVASQVYGHWWRVEGQIRGEKARNMLYGYNPFIGLEFIRPAIDSSLDIRTKAMLEYLQNHPNELDRLSKNIRSKYKQLLIDQGEPIQVHPALLYSMHLEDVLEELNSWLTIWERGETENETWGRKQTRTIRRDRREND